MNQLPARFAPQGAAGSVLASPPTRTSVDADAARTVTPTVPDHELLGRIGRGSYGEVWLARNVLGTYRAVKIVFRAQFEDDRPFEREFRGIQKFEPVSRSHQGLVDVLHVGRNEESRYFYYVMELADDFNAASIAGSFSPHSPGSYAPRTLGEELKRRGPLPAAQCIQSGLGLAEALAHLHEHGLVHRDVKPSNIVFVGGVPKLADIGLVADFSEARSFVGTDGFIPPEGPGSPKADLYSLGKVLYEISTGLDRRDFPALPPTLKNSPDRAALSELNEVIVKACANDPRQRYANAKAMVAELELLRRGSSIKRRRVWHRYGTFAWKAVLVTAMVLLAPVVVSRLLRSDLEQYMQSSNPLVNHLVTDGFERIRGGYGERIRSGSGCFDEALKFEPNFLPALYGRADVDIRLGLDDPANLAHFHAMADKLKRLYRGWAETLQTVAWDERKKGHYMESLELAKKATLSRAACPQGRAYSFFEYAYFLQCAGSAEAARDQYTVAVDKYAQDPVIEDHLAQTYLMQTNFVQGLEHLQKSIEQLPTHQNGHLYLGRAYEAMNNFDKAIAEFKEAERLRGNDAKSQAFYDELRRAAQQGGADGYWRRQLLEALTDPHEPYRIAKCYAHLGPAEKENAYKFLELACEQHDSSIEAMLCDLAWDRNDERVKSVARKVGLIR